jgi:ParB-like chromosome segregation protein Spo0J
MAARQLGLREVPVVGLEHLSEAQKRAYIIADNQLATTAGWDDELLAEEVGWLRGERFDLDLLGFDVTELERLLSLDGGEAEAEAEDEVPEPRKEPVTRRGDLWLLGEHRLLCGDATVLADVERVLGGAGVEVVGAQCRQPRQHRVDLGLPGDEGCERPLLVRLGLGLDALPRVAA